MKNIFGLFLFVAATVYSYVQDQCVAVDWTESRRLKVIQYFVSQLGVDAIGMRALGKSLNYIPVEEEWIVDLNKNQDPFDVLGRPTDIKMRIYGYGVKNIAAMQPTPEGVRSESPDTISIEMLSSGTIEFHLDAEIRVKTRVDKRSEMSRAKSFLKRPFRRFKNTAYSLVNQRFRRRYIFTFSQPRIRFDVALVLYRCDSSTTASWLLCTALSWGDYVASAWSSVFTTALNYLNTATSTEYSDIVKSLLSRVGQIEVTKVDFAAQSIKLKSLKEDDSKGKIVQVVNAWLRRKIKADPSTCSIITDPAAAAIRGGAQAKLDKLKPLFQSKCRMPAMQAATLAAASTYSYYQHGLLAGTAMSLGFSPIAYRASRRVATDPNAAAVSTPPPRIEQEPSLGDSHLSSNVIPNYKRGEMNDDEEINL